MAGESDSEPSSTGYKPWWAIDKEAWQEKFSLVSKINSLKQYNEKPLPPWTDTDVDEFAQEDPIHGQQLKLVRQGALASAIGAVVGGVGTAAFSYRYSRSMGGAALTFVFGVTAGWAVSEEVANVALGLYKFNAMDTNLKFLEWWSARQGR